MKPHFVFVPGDNAARVERNVLQEKMETSIRNFGIAGSFSGVSVAKWRPIRIPVCEPEIDDAISDVMAGLMEPDAPLLVCGHGMGAVLAACALNRIMSMGKTRSGALLTLGSHFGDGFKRQDFKWVPWFIWAKPPLQTMGVREWHDVWCSDDGPVYHSFIAAQSHKLDIQGRPSIATPMAEYSAYFGEGLIYSLALGLAEKITTP